MSEVISSFRSLRSGSQVFALLMLFLCVILHTMSLGKNLQLLYIFPFGMLCLSAISMFVKIMLAVCTLVGMKINDYLTEMSRFLQDNSLLISAPKSTITLLTPDPKQANTHPKIKISDAELPRVRNPKLLGVYLDTFFSFNTHCVQMANRVSKRNNVLKAMADTNWGQQKETLLLTYKALGRSIANYAAPVWSTNASDTSLGKIQRT